MKIFELLTGTTQPTPNPMSPTAPMASAPTPGMAPGAPGVAPMKTAGLWDTISNFATTPHPIGGNAVPSAPTPTTTPGGQPVQTPGSAFGDRMFGSSAVGKTLDAVNSGLRGTTPPQQ